MKEIFSFLEKMWKLELGYTNKMQTNIFAKNVV